MKSFYRFLIVVVVLGFSALNFFLFSKKKDAAPSKANSTDAGTADSEAVRNSASGPVLETFTQSPPLNTIPGERIIYFSNHDDYIAYLKQLSDQGLSPLSVIDALLAIRVSEDVVYQSNPEIYGGKKNFAYKVTQPLPPVDLDPELLAQLRAFKMPANAIVGESFEGDGAGILVAVLDSGIDDHNYFDKTNLDLVDLTDGGIGGLGSGHGTAVASIIAGSNGIAPAADLLVIRVLDNQGVGSGFDLAEGIIKAVDHGAQLINLSLGLYQDSQVLREAVRYADQNGVVLIAAAGNDGYDQLPYPAAYLQVISVTAVDRRGRQAIFPNQSKSIHFAAPGVGILTADEGGETQLFSGTSAAAPFVTGTFASLLSANPNLAPKQVVDLVGRYLDDAGVAGPDRFYGGGLLNWDRLRERSTNDITDFALADIYLQPDAQPGTTMPIEVTVQNRGTRWLTSGELTVLVGESAPQEFIIGTLSPGQTTTRKVYVPVPALGSGEQLKIAAQVLGEEASMDVRPENNAKAVFFKPNFK